MRIAVTIVSFRSADMVKKCLDALALSTYTDFDVIICENAGSESYRLLASACSASLPRGQSVEVICAPSNIGYAGGINLCMSHAQDADAFWILNPDTEPMPDALAALVRKLENGSYGAVGGRLLDRQGIIQSDGGIWRRWLARAVSVNKGVQASGDDATDVGDGDLSYVSGASLLISRRFLDVVGEMREDYFLYCEEVEWCLRGRRKGMTIGFTSEAIVLHDQGGTTGSAVETRNRPRLPIQLDERNKLNVVRDTTPAALPVAAMSALLLIALRYGRIGTLRQLGFALAGWRDGVLNRRGKPLWVQ